MLTKHEGPWVDESDGDQAWFDCNDPAIIAPDDALVEFARMDDGMQAVNDGCALIADGPHEAYTDERGDLVCDGDTIPDEIPGDRRFEVYRVRVVDPPETVRAHMKRRHDAELEALRAELAVATVAHLDCGEEYEAMRNLADGWSHQAAKSEARIEQGGDLHALITSGHHLELALRNVLEEAEGMATAAYPAAITSDEYVDTVDAARSALYEWDKRARRTVVDWWNR